MKKVYLLGTCSTCSRIMNEINDPSIEVQDIKTEPITKAQIEEMRSKTDSYESLFSKRAMKYKAWGLKEKNLSEEDLKNYILEEYTFLKRPVFIIDDEIFIGNSKKVVEQVIEKLRS